MNIKQFAMKTGLTARAIRFYEEKGILRSKRDRENQYRIFDSEQVEVARRIAHFRQLGFSVRDIASMLATSPNLSVGSVNKNIQSNLKKLYREKAETEKRIQQTEALIAKVLQKINEEHLGKRHELLAKAYENLHRDPNWLDLK